MPTTNGNRKILDLKRWETVANAPVTLTAGMFISQNDSIEQNALLVSSNTGAWLYSVAEDGWTALPSPALAGTFGAGACGVSHNWSTGSTITAQTLGVTSGTTSTIVTNQTLARDLRGFSVHIVSGPNAGETKVIASNTVGANATITFTSASGSAFSNLNTFRLMTPRWYVLGAGTLAAGSFRVYDLATNTWTSLSNTGLPATWGTEGRLVATPSWSGTNYNAFTTGTATAGGASTITNTAKNWTTNQWTNYQIRLTGGTGAGQIRTIASNTATVITVGTAWTTAPDATTSYSIEGNDDFLYLMGNNGITLYRYQISTNTWTTHNTGRASGGATATSGNWISNVDDSLWSNENAIINGRRIYSFRGSNSAIVDIYDIPSNSWTSDQTYTPKNESLGTGTKYTCIRNNIYIQINNSGRCVRYDVNTNKMDGWGLLTYSQGTAVNGDTLFAAYYVDGATTINYVYFGLNNSASMLRQMVI